MLHMLEDKTKNAAIFIGSIVVFAVSLWLVRSQATVDDVSYMKAMIPHHSIAILTSERAHITALACANWPMASSKHSAVKSTR